VLAHPSAYPDEPSSRVVRYSDDALTVRLTNEPVRALLEEIGRQTGAEIQGQLSEVREVSADFEAVPLPEALRRLLGNENFALVYGDKGRLKAVKLLGRPQVAGASIGRATMMPTTTIPEPEPEATVASLMDTPVTLLMASRLARVLGKQTAPLREIIQVGVRSEDASVRAEAVRAALRTIENDPRFRTATAEAVGGLDDTSLATMLRAAAGEHAAEIARLVAAQTRIVPLRVKADTFLRSQPDQ